MPRNEVEAAVTAAHIIEVIESIEEQLAEIRRWADQLIPREDMADDDDA